MTKHRITIETLASGQPRPYADHRLVVRVTFERDWNGKGYVPNEFDKDTATAYLKGLRCGFTDEPQANWASPKLTRFETTLPGVWEFEVTEAFTD